MQLPMEQESNFKQSKCCPNFSLAASFVQFSELKFLSMQPQIPKRRKHKSWVLLAFIQEAKKLNQRTRYAVPNLLTVGFLISFRPYFGVPCKLQLTPKIEALFMP